MADSLLALSTILIGAFAAWIAWRQHRLERARARTADDALRMELFDRRFRVFEAARKLVRQATNNARLSTADLQTFGLETADAGFLFGPEVVAHLDDLRRLAAKAREEARRSKDFQGMADGLTAIFQPYLGVSEAGVISRPADRVAMTRRQRRILVAGLVLAIVPPLFWTPYRLRDAKEVGRAFWRTNRPIPQLRVAPIYDPPEIFGQQKFGTPYEVDYDRLAVYVALVSALMAVGMTFRGRKSEE